MRKKDPPEVSSWYPTDEGLLAGGYPPPGADAREFSIDKTMSVQKVQIREELYRLLLNEEAGVACNLVPRMLADPESLTPEIRWCLLYLVRGIGFIASRHGLLHNGGLLDAVLKGFEESRRVNERLDWMWFSVVREDENHWVQRYESTDVRYSLEELAWLHRQLAALWKVERQRLELEAPPLTPLVLRQRERLRAEVEPSEPSVSRSVS